MKRLLLFSVTIFIIATHLEAQHAEGVDAAKAYQDYMTPGPMHKWLAGHAGTWESETKMWMDPSAPPTTSKATDVVTMSMNGLFQIGNFSSTMMGMPFKGQSTLGYDNAKKKFVMSWIDAMSSGMVFMKGDYDAATKTLTLTGTQTDPITGKDTEIMQVNVYHDENSYTSTMYGAGPDGKQMKFLEGTYKRKK